MNPPADRDAVPAVTALVLCGGAGSRMGGADKGLAELPGGRLVDHVIRRLAPQVENRFVLSCNRNADHYGALGFPLVADAPALAQGGPLAGIAAGLPLVRTPLCVVCPCDTPLIPHDLVQRLLTARQARHDPVAVVHDGTRRQPLHCLLDTSLAENLQCFLRDGGHAVHRWLEQCDVAEADFSDCPEAFGNVNTTAELAACAEGLKEQPPCKP